MARSPKFAEWSEWIQEQLKSRGWLPSDLVRASGDRLVNKTVYNWMSGINGVSSETAVVVAEALGVELVDVLRAGGHHALADAVAKLQAGAPTPTVVAEPEMPVDPNLKDLLEDPEFKSLPPAAQKKLLDFYYRQREQAAAELRHWGDLGERPDEPGQRRTA